MVVNYDWFFLSHRLPIALAARDAGLRVEVATSDTGCADAIRETGFDFHPLPLRARSMNAMHELAAVGALAGLYRRVRPDLVHHVTIKPILYGSLAARVLPDVAVVNAVSGLGYIFSDAPRAQRLRPFVETLYRMALAHPHSWTIFQNPEDRKRFVGRGLIGASRTALIRGSGVNGELFQVAPEPVGRPIVLLPARLIWDKGIGEFVEAARRLAAMCVPARFVLVGQPDTGNPNAVPVSSLQAWVEEGVVEWWGHRTDMPAVFAASAIVVLPTTYPEGVPKSLLEAAAVGRPIIATDSPGCREIVRDGGNGLLVQPRDVDGLVTAIAKLLAEPAMRRTFGLHGAALARAEFSEAAVVSAHLDIYARLLNHIPGVNGRRRRRHEHTSSDVSQTGKRKHTGPNRLARRGGIARNDRDSS